MCFRPSGTLTTGEIKCPRCGTMNPLSADACKGCGAKASDFAAAPQAPTAPKAPVAPQAPKAPSAPKAPVA